MINVSDIINMFEFLLYSKRLSTGFESVPGIHNGLPLWGNRKLLKTILKPYNFAFI